jgi:BirA family biotin operon repressor/biotin-[acetyl-CoA-carboxylase] ligase
MADDLSLKSIQATLTGRFGKPLRYLDVTGSTNADAVAWAADGAPEGALVVADHQTAGRGRWGRTWLSEPGRALLFSLVLRPRRPVASMGLLTTVAGVACAEGIEEVTGLPARIKWPNDVTMTSRKLAGILVESRSAGSNLDVAVVGVGINVGWGDYLQGDLAESATSIAVELERLGRTDVPPRREVLVAVLSSLERLYRADAEDVLRAASLKSDVLGRRVRVKFPDGSSLDGVATRLLQSGALEVDVAGTLRAVRMGEIEQVRLF